MSVSGVRAGCRDGRVCAGHARDTPQPWSRTGPESSPSMDTFGGNFSDRLPANRCFSTNRHDPNLLRSSVCPPESSTSGHALSACSSAAVSIVNPEPKCGPPPTLYTPAIRCG